MNRVELRPRSCPCKGDASVLAGPVVSSMPEETYSSTKLPAASWCFFTFLVAVFSAWLLLAVSQARAVNALQGASVLVTHAYDYDALAGVTDPGHTRDWPGPSMLYDAIDAPASRNDSGYDTCPGIGCPQAPELGTRHLGVRYYRRNLGGFWTMDGYEGSNRDPLSLHKYLYCQGNPVNRFDPSGQNSLGEINIATFISVTINLSSAYSNIRAKRYAAALVDVVGAFSGLGGLSGPGSSLVRAFAGGGVSTAVNAAQAGQRISQGVAIFDILMMVANSMTGGGSAPAPESSGGGSVSGSERVPMNGDDVAIGLVKDGKVLKWAKYGDGDFRLAPSHEGLAKLMKVLVDRGMLEPGVEAFTVWKEAGKVMVRGSNNFNVEVSEATRRLVEQTFLFQ